MQGRTYGQMCPIARSLDVLGERWTLLLVRELLLGPKKFKDFLKVMPSIGTNRLSERLKLLVDTGVAVQTPPPGAAYALTEWGEQLRGPLLALGLWGLRLPADDQLDQKNTRAELIALSMSTLNKPEKSKGLRFTHEFQIGTEVFNIQVNDGAMKVFSGRSAGPADVTVICDLETFVAMAAGLPAADVGAIRIETGTKARLMRLFDLLERPPLGVVESLLANSIKTKGQTP
jgi:DNA-binding HxlR family transcriptional regulator